MSNDNKEPTAGDLRSKPEEFRRLTEGELRSMTGGIDLYWGPGVYPDGRPEKSDQYFFLIRNGIDIFAHGGTARLVDKSSEAGIALEWERPGASWAQGWQLKAANKVGGDASERREWIAKEIGRIVFAWKDKLYEKIEMPTPEVYEDLAAEEPNLWFVDGDEVRNEYIQLKAGKKKDDLAFSFRASTLSRFFTDMSNVGKMFQKLLKSKPWGTILGHMVGAPLAGKLGGWAKELSEADKLAKKLLKDKIKEKDLEVLSEILIESGLDSSVSAEEILKMAFMMKFLKSNG